MPELHKHSPAEVRLVLLGGFDLVKDGLAVPLVLSAQRLLAFLALQSRSLPRVYVAGLLWGGATEARAGGSLRTALWRLKEADLDIVESQHDHLRLAPTVALDTREAEAWARAVLDPAAECPDGTSSILPFREELLPGWYDDWVVLERERQRQLGVHALELLADRLTASGRHGGAVLAGLAAVQAEPLRESAHRVLIRAHLAEGNPTDAIRQYRRYVDLLRRELDIPPSSAMHALVRGLV